MQLIFRRLEPADREAVAQVCAGAFPSGDYVPSLFDTWIADPQALFIGAVDPHGVLRGIARGRLVDGGATAWCEGVRVHQEARGRRVGRALVEYIVAWARTAGARRVRASVGSENTASQALFATCGFTEVTRFDRWFAPPGPGGRLPRPYRSTNWKAPWPSSTAMPR